MKGEASIKWLEETKLWWQTVLVIYYAPRWTKMVCEKNRTRRNLQRRRTAYNNKCTHRYTLMWVAGNRRAKPVTLLWRNDWIRPEDLQQRRKPFKRRVSVSRSWTRQRQFKEYPCRVTVNYQKQIIDEEIILHMCRNTTRSLDHTCRLVTAVSSIAGAQDMLFVEDPYYCGYCCVFD